jgi:alpha-ketoglutaric semialdehyde dehydrogenase
LNDYLLNNHVDGVWMAPASGARRRNENPADTADAIGLFAESEVADVKDAVAAAERSRADWKAVGPIARSRVVGAAGRIIAEREDEFAAAITREQGKLLRESVAEVHRACSILEFIAGEGRRFNGYTAPADDPHTVAMVYRVGLGVVGLITPWNFPLAIPVWKVAPALLAGCTAVLKPSPLTPHTAALLVQAFADSGLPAGVLNLIQGDAAAGEALVADPRVAGISFTGSIPVGRTIQQAGATRLLRTQLELGGKNAVLVLQDADLDAAADAIVVGAFSQAGQRCSATSRAIVERQVLGTMIERIAMRVSALRVGSPLDPHSDLGPLVSESRMRACLDAIAGAHGTGAKTAVGVGSSEHPGAPLPAGGYYVQPTVLYDVPWDSELAQREIFGPVLAVIECKDFEDGVRISNSVEYGMSATIFSRDMTRVFEALDRFEAGMLHVNRPGTGAYTHLPHVGTKQSQFGPPECSPQVFDFYCEWRSACINVC